MIIYMLFALTHSNLSGQLPAETGIIQRLTEFVCVRHSISPIKDTAGGEADKSEYIFGTVINTIVLIPMGDGCGSAIVDQEPGKKR
jgi:hypothetical protein